MNGIGVAIIVSVVGLIALLIWLVLSWMAKSAARHQEAARRRWPERHRVHGGSIRCLGAVSNRIWRTTKWRTPLSQR